MRAYLFTGPLSAQKRDCIPAQGHLLVLHYNFHPIFDKIATFQILFAIKLAVVSFNLHFFPNTMQAYLKKEIFVRIVEVM